MAPARGFGQGGPPGRTFCMQSWPNLSAASVPVQGLGGCGARQRRSPTGRRGEGNAPIMDDIVLDHAL